MNNDFPLRRIVRDREKFLARLRRINIDSRPSRRQKLSFPRGCRTATSYYNALSI
jgi:hypothetical protein